MYNIFVNIVHIFESLSWVYWAIVQKVYRVFYKEFLESVSNLYTETFWATKIEAKS